MGRGAPGLGDLSFALDVQHLHDAHVRERLAERRVRRLGDRVDEIRTAQDETNACVQVFFIRAGKLLGREYFVLEGTALSNTEDVLSSFVQQFYDQAAYVPPEILLPEMIDEAKIIESWLKNNKNATTTIRVPYNGRHELLQMAEENTHITLETIKQQ